jgi:hypothetical protein
MGVNMLFARFWQWLTRRSAPNAAPPAVPYVPPNPAGPAGWSNNGLPIQPLERNVEVYAISGMKNQPGQVDCRFRSAAGEMIRRHEDHGRGIGACGHLIDFEKAPHHRGIGGLCIYCLREYQALVDKGLMDPLEAERLSIVCSDCCQMTSSGHLCCPRHRKAMATPDGETVYLDPDAAKSMARQNTIAKALNVVTWLFAEPQNPQKDKTSDQD